MVLELDLRVVSAFYSRQADLAAKERRSIETVAVKPTGKPPVKFVGVEVATSTFGDPEEGLPDYTYVLYATNKGLLVLVMEEVTYHGNVEDNGGYGTFTKLRILNTYDDVWSFATSPAEMNRLTTALEHAGRNLCNDPSFFYKPI